MAIAHPGILVFPTPGSRALALRPGDPDFKNPDTLDVKHIRVKYDVEKAAKAVEESPLPDPFADMLRNGG